MKIKTSIMTAMAFNYNNYARSLARWMEDEQSILYRVFGFFCVEDEI